MIVTAAVRSTNQSDHSAVGAVEQSEPQSNQIPERSQIPNHEPLERRRTWTIRPTARSECPTRRRVSTSRPATGPSSCSPRWPRRPAAPRCIGGLGGFAGLFALKGGYKEPLLAASTDGVGTKIAVAQAMDKHDTVGLDLVAMVVDDLVVCGAEPLFLQDYIAVGRVVPERVAELVSGIADGCIRPAARCSAARRRSTPD